MISFDKYILVIGPSEPQFLEAVQELANLYPGTDFVNQINTYKSTSKNNQYIVDFTNTPDFERFKYFVNYFNYPETDDFESYSAKVFGFWTISANDKLPKDKYGKRALLYVSDNDTEGDNVYAVFSGESKVYKLGFAIGQEFSDLGQKEFDFAEPEFQGSDFTSLKSINPGASIKKSTKTRSGCMATFALLVFTVIGLGILVI